MHIAQRHFRPSKVASKQPSAAHRVEDLLQDIRPVRPVRAALCNGYRSSVHSTDQFPACSRWCSFANR